MLKVESIADVDTVGDITRHHARTRPDRVAIHFEGRRITFSELDRRTNQVANGLIAEGVRPQARIAFLSKNVPAFFELWFGAAKTDVVLVPVNLDVYKRQTLKGGASPLASSIAAPIRSRTA